MLNKCVNYDSQLHKRDFIVHFGPLKIVMVRIGKFCEISIYYTSHSLSNDLIPQFLVS